MSDSDPLLSVGRAPDDLAGMSLDILSGVQFKLIGFMLLIFIVINTDVFIDRALSRFSGAVDFKCPTSYGTTLQGLFLAVSCIIVDAAIRQKIV